jgi:hypothetical protein
MDVGDELAQVVDVVEHFWVFLIDAEAEVAVVYKKLWNYDLVTHV